MSTETAPAWKVGEIVTGQQANRLPVGSQIRWHEQHEDDPVWTKTQDTPYEPEWTTPGHMGWPISENGLWVVVSLPV